MKKQSKQEQERKGILIEVLPDENIQVSILPTFAESVDFLSTIMLADPQVAGLVIAATDAAKAFCNKYGATELANKDSVKMLNSFILELDEKKNEKKQENKR